MDINEDQSMNKIGNNSGHTVGSTISKTIGVVAHTAAGLGNLAESFEVLTGVVLQKSINFAEISAATDAANLSVTKTMLNAEIAALEASLPAGSKLRQLEL